MPKKYPTEVTDRAARMLRDHEGDYGSVTAACVAVGGQLAPTRSYNTLQRSLRCPGERGFASLNGRWRVTAHHGHPKVSIPNRTS
jgi:hypothetical protein